MAPVVGGGGLRAVGTRPVVLASGKDPIAAASNLAPKGSIFGPREDVKSFVWFRLPRFDVRPPLPGSVMVAQQVLVLLVEVRVLAG